MVKKKSSKKPKTVSLSSTHWDLVIAALVVSVSVNVFILIGWVALQVTTAYDSEVASFLFVR